MDDVVFVAFLPGKLSPYDQRNSAPNLMRSNSREILGKFRNLFEYKIDIF